MFDRLTPLASYDITHVNRVCHEESWSDNRTRSADLLQGTAAKSFYFKILFGL